MTTTMLFGQRPENVNIQYVKIIGKMLWNWKRYFIKLKLQSTKPCLELIGSDC